ncbi:MAG: hypothetical protein A3C02_04890 [Candidatus Andersenbacteria bacterium RIFCSPHIGHO2_02_FULL_45_11]|uniref:Uncharacterized protein n=1 Tax=Candidatus Andersenbacteria bacterium RIFCSPHIGHO2_12_FULL_45_11 TaxID=1797281 RepID=A0A1G1X3A4_9BACT|nr:MAG: hypothetical protein A2805_02445 [Candidatus Andersenbacteria bacterium RIFCSPHIGHO2_01_FULL_46_36]OGY32877.1 MAG: hypothetical protein A3C02_04890 [Candidatus Andersenbacteria bacterium RIFCSPHIGHO2_02_FULL_45_11]OGY34050.1 MAG: hypothetical protein A3D99_02225 [Candidatus Andersenbacteria bacterium RIFCSPHIGHO2_12_FULL_45_11]
MEYEQQQNQDDNFMNRVKESPRTVSAIIIVVIVAAAIYAFSGNNQQNNEVALNSPEATPEASATPAPEKKEEVKGATATPAPVDKAVLSENAKKLPEARTTDSAYIEVAQKGDGLTHVARRAATRYLADHETGYSVTNEHRIYIEDYIRKHMEKGSVSVGAEKTISFDLVKQAIESAGKLTPKQLKNLTQYTGALR